MKIMFKIYLLMKTKHGSENRPAWPVWPALINRIMIMTMMPRFIQPVMHGSTMRYIFWLTLGDDHHNHRGHHSNNGDYHHGRSNDGVGNLNRHPGPTASRPSISPWSPTSSTSFLSSAFSSEQRWWWSLISLFYFRGLFLVLLLSFGSILFPSITSRFHVPPFASLSLSKVPPYMLALISIGGSRVTWSLSFSL